MELAISSIGMTTSLGGVVRGSAAHRAGLSRPRTLEPYHVFDGDGYAPIVGHHALSDAERCSGVRLWLRLAAEAVRDLLDYGAIPGPSDERFWSRTAVVAAVPFMDATRFRAPEAELAERLRPDFLDRILEILSLSTSVQQRLVLPAGQTAVARALAAARSLMAARRAERALIVAVDSWADPSSLLWLGARGRLRAGGGGDGLSPSEAAACVLVERPEVCSERGGRIEGYVMAESVVGSPAAGGPLDDQEGRHLARAVAEVVEAIGARGASLNAYVDLNGERHKVVAWSIAQTLLKHRLGAACSRVDLLSSSFGDTGAAGAAVAICLGTRAFVRGYAAADRTLVLSISERGDAGAVALRRADANPERGR